MSSSPRLFNGNKHPFYPSVHSRCVSPFSVCFFSLLFIFIFDPELYCGCFVKCLCMYEIMYEYCDATLLIGLLLRPTNYTYCSVHNKIFFFSVLDSMGTQNLFHSPPSNSEASIGSSTPVASNRLHARHFVVCVYFYMFCASAHCIMPE